MDVEEVVARAAPAVWLRAGACRLEEFVALVDRETELADYPFASEIRANTPIYDGEAVRRLASAPDSRQALLAEWVRVMMDGPGIVVFTGAFPDGAVVDQATQLFEAIITEQRAANTGVGDHFAKPGANDRIWNALEKHCLRDPEGFARYYANEVVALVAEAWLGPAYQITAQVNVVNPGGAAQSPHRDYHLGFQTDAEAERYPIHVHRLSPVLTLQGAVAHTNMPVETGPTLYLPYSQRYVPGYLAWRRPEFRDYFEQHHVQLPLSKGDAVFFNPAVFHAAGHNRTADVRRMANLLQISSAYGRAMESVDRTRMSEALYPTLCAMAAHGVLTPREADNVVAASAEGYSFPTNLDRDPPIGGLAPQSQQALVRQALAERWDPKSLIVALEAQAERQLT